MAYLADPGGRFDSDTHRRVLAHLTLPTDDYGWSEPALLERMRPDVGTSLSNPEEVKQVLSDLEGSGLAHQPVEGVWQQTQEGFDLLTGSIANEPTLEDAQGGTTAATIGADIGGATRFSGEGPAGVSPEDVQQDDAEQPPQEVQA